MPAKKSEEADVRIFAADMKTNYAHTEDSSGLLKQPYIVLDRRQFGEKDKNGNWKYSDEILRDIFSHELGHVKGRHHPDEGHGLAEGSKDRSAAGYAPAYNMLLTVQSYNGHGEARKRSHSVGDVLVDQKNYGTPKDDGTLHIITQEWLLLAARGVLWAPKQKPMAIDLSGSNYSGYIEANLSGSDHINDRISGSLEGKKGTIRLDVQTAYDARIKDINVADSDIDLIVVGTHDSRITAGKGYSSLTAGGGNNVMIGGEKRNGFVFNEKSGTGNIILNFNQQQDYIKGSNGEARLNYYARYPTTEGTFNGTLIEFTFDKNGSNPGKNEVFVKDVTPAGLKGRLTNNQKHRKLEVLIATPAPQEITTYQIARSFDKNNNWKLENAEYGRLICNDDAREALGIRDHTSMQEVVEILREAGVKSLRPIRGDGAPVAFSIDATPPVPAKPAPSSGPSSSTPGRP